MRLTVHTDYAMRVLMYLAVEEGRLVTIEEMAAAHGISRNHLMKVAQQLGQFGFVEAVRGRGGGLRLARPAAGIGVGEVVRRTEESFQLVDCMQSGGGTCRIVPACRLKHVLAQALEAFAAVLDGYTLADLVGARAPEMRRLLAGSEAPGRDAAAR